MSEQEHEYHAGERAAHERAGLQEQAEHVRGIVGTTIPAAATTFLASQQIVFLAAADEGGRLWATALTGPVGFARAVSDDQLHLSARPGEGDPLAATLAGPAKVGLLALEPATRRRMRLNGRVRPDGRSGLLVESDEVYANCPKYIQQRTIERDDDRDGSSEGHTAGPATTTAALTQDQQRRLRAADTFVIATRSAAGDADCSHRGGNPGFVQVVDDRTLLFPDYLGNAMLMTLGNLLEDPRAGLLVVDWSTGTALHLTGTARIDWAPGDELPGAQRTVTFRVESAVDRPHALPLHWSAPAYSRHNPDLELVRP